MDLLNNLGIGLSVATLPANILYCFVGTLLGTLIGVLPGIGPLATIAMLLPLTFALEPTSSLIMLAGIYYGAQYGGSTTAILVNLPGEVSSTVTTLEGYKMSLKGEAGTALAAAALGSFFAGTVATLLIAVVAKPLTGLALSFGSAEYFSLMVVGLVSSIALASGSILKAIGMIIFGLLLGMVGTDIITGAHRFTFGTIELFDGVDFVAIAVGVFGVGEILRNMETVNVARPIVAAIGRIWPRRAELRRMAMPAVRGTAIGSVLGVLPGGGAILSSFIAYNVEKKVSSNGHRFGQGMVEGVAAPEAANNAGAQTSFIPMLALGIPSNAVMALMVGAMIMKGIVPSPTVVTRNPELYWGLIASMWVGNVMLVILNLPLVGLWVRLLQVPYRILFPAIIAFCCIGVYSTKNSEFGVYVVTVAGLLGYLLVKLGCEMAPFVLGFVLGPLLEEHLLKAMVIAGGDATAFITRPISGVLLAVAVLLLIAVSIPTISRRRNAVFAQED